MQFKLSILLYYGVFGHMFELLYSIDDFLKWNSEKLTTGGAGGGYPPPPGLIGLRCITKIVNTWIKNTICFH